MVIIREYPIEIAAVQVIHQVPSVRKWMGVFIRFKQPMIRVLIAPSTLEPFKIYMHRTDRDIEGDPGQYIGSFERIDDSYAHGFHVFGPKDTYGA